MNSAEDAEKKTIEDAKKIWSSSLGWKALRASGLESAAADFIINFSSQIQKKQPSIGEMLVVAFRWSKLSAAERTEKIDKQKTVKAGQVVANWEPIQMMGAKQTDVNAAESFVQTFVSITPPPSPYNVKFGEPIVAEVAAEPIMRPASEDQTGDLPEQIVDPVIAENGPANPQTPEASPFTMEMPSPEEMQQREILTMMLRAEVATLKKLVDELLQDENFDPKKPTSEQGESYIRQALALREKIYISFPKLLNNREEIWARAHEIIADLNDRMQEIEEKENPTYQSEHGYVYFKAKQGIEIETKTEKKENNPDIEIAKIGSIKLYSCASKESYRDHGGESGHGQDAVGVRQILSKDGESVAYHLIQADGVGQGFRSEFFTKFLVKLLLKTQLNDERLLYAAAAGYQELLTMEDLENIPDLLANALKIQMNEYGSATTINQIAIGPDGKVGGSFRGDGIFGVARQSGETEIYSFGSAAGALKTKRISGSNLKPFENYQTNPLSVEDITGGDEIVLNSGDYLLLSSDGLEHGNRKFEKIIAAIASGISGEELDTLIFETFWEEEQVEDDKGLLIYQHT